MHCKTIIEYQQVENGQNDAESATAGLSAANVIETQTLSVCKNLVTKMARSATIMAPSLAKWMRSDNGHTLVQQLSNLPPQLHLNPSGREVGTVCLDLNHPEPDHGTILIGTHALALILGGKGLEGQSLLSVMYICIGVFLCLIIRTSSDGPHHLRV
jgi:hypothetical protein